MHGSCYTFRTFIGYCPYRKRKAAPKRQNDESEKWHKWNYNYICCQGVKRDVCPLEIQLCGHIEAGWECRIELRFVPLVIQVDVVEVPFKAQTRHVFRTREIGLKCDQWEIPPSARLLFHQSTSTLANKFAWRTVAHKSVCSISALRVD